MASQRPSGSRSWFVLPEHTANALSLDMSPGRLDQRGGSILDENPWSNLNANQHPRGKNEMLPLTRSAICLLGHIALRHLDGLRGATTWQEKPIDFGIANE
jgi:hypothetical protein